MSTQQSVTSNAALVANGVWLSIRDETQSNHNSIGHNYIGHNYIICEETQSNHNKVLEPRSRKHRCELFEVETVVDIGEVLGHGGGGKGGGSTAQESIPS